MPSFDVVSQVPWNEVDNAVNQAQKEIAQRFDFKGTGSELERTGPTIAIRSSSDDRVKAVLDVLREKLVRRKVSLKHLDVGKLEQTARGGSKVTVTIKDGIDSDHARQIIKLVKDEKLKVQTAIQDQQVRVTGKKRDDLQEVIRFLRERDLDIDLQFVNFRD